MKIMTPPVVMSIAGSDNTAGAGIQADIKTCSAFNAYCTTVVTAVTAQNHEGLYLCDYVGNYSLERQLQATIDYCHPSSVKIGLLPHPDAVEIIANFIKKSNLRNIVIDPLLRTTAGDSCVSKFSESTKEAMLHLLFPLSTLTTPNLPELHHIVGSMEITNIEEAAEIIFSRYKPAWLLVKGGHTEEPESNDLLLERGKGVVEEFKTKRIDTKHGHGTGCTLSSGIAAGLAYGLPMAKSVKEAKRFLTEALKNGANWEIVSHGGPLAHF